MAIGPLARIIAQVIVPVVAVLARALPAAYAQALQNAKKSGVSSTESMQQMLRKTITRQEALQILNLSEETATAEAIQKVRACSCWFVCLLVWKLRILFRTIQQLTSFHFGAVCLYVGLDPIL
jgi:hypothetical protein